jgi:hypothetical protein
VTRCLDRAKIAYMVTGSIATNLYTIPHMTRDIDIVVELSEKDLSRFIPLFEADYYLDPETVRDTVGRGMFNLIHDEYIIKIDFVVRKDTPTATGSSRKKKVAVDDQDLYVGAGRSDSIKTGLGERLRSKSAQRRAKSLEVRQRA